MANGKHVLDEPDAIITQYFILQLSRTILPTKPNLSYPSKYK